MTNFARTEREHLCDLALQVGPDHPTLCGDWTVKDLVVHLLVRERSLVGAPGILVPALSGATERASERLRRSDLEQLVERLRNPRGSWAGLPGVEQAANTVEFFVHHEDVRRAAAGWEPRTLQPEESRLLWNRLKVMGRALARPAGVPLVVVEPATGSRAVLRGGDDPVVLSGAPGERLLFLFGRAEHHGLEFGGPPGSVARLQSASLGF